MAANKIDVYVKLPTGRGAQYDMGPQDTIKTICEKIAEEEKVKLTQVRLKYQGKILNLSHTMKYLGVRPETILKAEILVPRPVNLMIALPNDLGETELTTTSLDTVDEVITRLADIIKESSNRIVLKYDGRPVRGKTLLDAGLVDGSALVVEVTETPPPADTSKTTGASATAKETNELGEDEKQAIFDSFHSEGRPVEVVFSFDTTGSMNACLQQVRQKLRESCTRLIQDIPNIRIGVIAHGDYCDAKVSYVIRIKDLTSDVQELADFVNNVPGTGGGDCPECYEWVLKKAQGLDWSEDSAKALVVIGDEAPHFPEYTDANVVWQDELSVLTGMGIKVYGVRALNNTGIAPFYEELAEVSGGHYLTMEHFDLITDMFLAVCYRESNEGGLEAFAKEVEEAGRMTEDRRQMFEKLEKAPSPAPAQRQSEKGQSDDQQRPKRYVRQPWWDPTISRGTQPIYHYDQQADTFIPYGEHKQRKAPTTRTTTASTSSTDASSSTRRTTSGSRSKSKTKCSIM